MVLVSEQFTISLKQYCVAELTGLVTSAAQVPKRNAAAWPDGMEKVAAEICANINCELIEI